jgi:hypothetical protein
MAATPDTWTYDTVGIRKRPVRHTDMELVLHWSLKAAVPLSRGHTPATMPAARLLTRYLREWVPRISKACGLPDGTVPIYWTVDGTGLNGEAHFETAPFQHAPAAGDPDDGGQNGDWLTCFSWPRSQQTGRPVNWLQLPVADLAWNARRADPGGFVQEALGWRPSPSETTVDIARLARLAGHRPT